MTALHLRSLAALLWVATTACGPDIKGEGLGDSGIATTHGPADTAEPADSGDPSDSGEPGAPPTGDVVVEYTIRWEVGDTTLELCTGTESWEDVPTSYRSWTLWTDAGLELDLSDLPASAPTEAPVGEGTTVSPGSYRFVLDAETDPDLPAYDALLAGGASPVCLLASGTDLGLRAAQVPESPPERTDAITAVELRLSVLWTDR